MSTVKHIKNIKRKKELKKKKKKAATRALMAGGYKSSYIRKKSAAKSYSFA